MQIPPSSKVSTWVRHYLIYHPTGSPCPMRYFSDGSPGIVAPLNNSTLPYLPDTKTETGKMMVYGIFDRYMNIAEPPESGMVIAVLQPYALTMLTGLSGYHFKNSVFSFRTLFPTASDVEKRIAKRKDPFSLIEALEGFFCGFDARSSMADQALMHSIILMQEHKGNTSIADIVKRLPLTERQLERKFNHYIGLTPKKFSSSLRITNYLKLIRQAKPGISPTQLALQAGYYDQAHLNNHFRSLTGITPSSYLSAADPLALNLFTR